MTYSERISEDLKAAMKAREKEKLEALRAVKTAFTLARSSKGAGSVLTGDEELRIMQKLVRQRKESADIYRQQNRSDLADSEIFEAEVIESYLPARMSGEELEKYISGLIKKIGASGMQDMGKIMGVATKELAGQADGKIISAIVRKLLS
jgi:uncharacterized protein YqeY